MAASVRIIGGSLAMAISACVPMGLYVEGVVPHTYADPAGIPTICIGETGPHVKWGQTATIPECIARYQKRLAIRWNQISGCIYQNLTVYQAASVLSFADNVGPRKFCTSTLVRLLNVGAEPNIWCAQMYRWKYTTIAGVKVVLNGLIKRRHLEHDLCMGNPHDFPKVAT